MWEDSCPSPINSSQITIHSFLLAPSQHRFVGFFLNPKSSARCFPKIQVMIWFHLIAVFVIAGEACSVEWTRKYRQKWFQRLLDLILFFSYHWLWRPLVYLVVEFLVVYFFGWLTDSLVVWWLVIQKTKNSKIFWRGGHPLIFILKVQFVTNVVSYFLAMVNDFY